MVATPHARETERLLRALKRSPGSFIGDAWVAGAGPELVAEDPTDGRALWRGRMADAAQVDQAMQTAAAGFDPWRRTPLEARYAVLTRYAALLQRDKRVLAALIAHETGKPLWECLGEVGAMVAKVAVTRRAWDARCGERRITPGVADVVGVRRVKPHGPVAVFGPFNLPGHLPNGHIVPALLAGNTVVFKPSEQTPLIAVALVERLLAAGLPASAIQLVQGAKDTGVALCAHPALRGLYFTGSSQVGRAIHAALAGRTEVVCALEMGGNNPLVVWPLPDWQAEGRGEWAAVAQHAVLSAFITGGQRCTCARRLIVPEGPAGERVVDAVVAQTRALTLDRWDAEPAPLYGALIHAGAARATVTGHDALVALGGRSLLAPTLRPEVSAALVTPGIVDITGVAGVPDAEVFGPLLRVIRVPDFDAALAAANATAYGLSAALLGGTQGDYERFWSEVDAGICNWNRATTGALSSLPFGGTGLSGNHRPAGWTSVDYCAWPVASTERPALATPASVPPGLADPTGAQP